MRQVAGAGERRWNSINNVSQCGDFELLKQQEPSQAARLGIEERRAWREILGRVRGRGAPLGEAGAWFVHGYDGRYRIRSMP